MSTALPGIRLDTSTCAKVIRTHYGTKSNCAEMIPIAPNTNFLDNVSWPHLQNLRYLEGRRAMTFE